MKNVYYRGHAYEFEEIDMLGQRLFVLYKEGEVEHYIKEDELDIRSRVTRILDAYYATPNTSIRMERMVS